MDEIYKKASSIFYPRLLSKMEEIDQNKMRFVQYTSANAAMNIIRSKEIWLRNVQCMNDYLEVNHGINCLIAAFHNKNEGARFQTVIEELFPGIIRTVGWAEARSPSFAIDGLRTSAHIWTPRLLQAKLSNLSCQPQRSRLQPCIRSLR
jgi:hypothetical protein